MDFTGNLPVSFQAIAVRNLLFLCWNVLCLPCCILGGFMGKLWYVPAICTNCSCCMYTMLLQIHHECYTGVQVIKKDLMVWSIYQQYQNTDHLGKLGFLCCQGRFQIVVSNHCHYIGLISWYKIWLALKACTFCIIGNLCTSPVNRIKLECLLSWRPTSHRYTCDKHWG